jgi:hypothetical protein
LSGGELDKEDVTEITKNYDKFLEMYGRNIQKDVIKKDDKIIIDEKEDEDLNDNNSNDGNLNDSEDESIIERIDQDFENKEKGKKVLLKRIEDGENISHFETLPFKDDKSFMLEMLENNVVKLNEIDPSFLDVDIIVRVLRKNKENFKNVPIEWRNYWQIIFLYLDTYFNGDVNQIEDKLNAFFEYFRTFTKFYDGIRNVLAQKTMQSSKNSYEKLVTAIKIVTPNILK